MKMDFKTAAYITAVCGFYFGKNTFKKTVNEFQLTFDLQNYSGFEFV